MGWHANYVVEFDEKAAPDLDWEDSRVKEAMKKLESRNIGYCQTVDLLYLRDHTPDTVIICLYAGACSQRRALMEVLQTLWNIYEVPMRFKEYGEDDSKFEPFQPSDDHLTDCARYYEEKVRQAAEALEPSDDDLRSADE